MQHEEKPTNTPTSPEGASVGGDAPAAPSEAGTRRSHTRRYPKKRHEVEVRYRLFGFIEVISSRAREMYPSTAGS